MAFSQLAWMPAEPAVAGLQKFGNHYTSNKYPDPVKRYAATKVVITIESTVNGDAGLEIAVDDNEAPLVYFYADVVKPELFGVRTATGREKDCVSLTGDAVRQADAELIAHARDRICPDAEEHLDAAILKDLRHHAGQLAIHRRLSRAHFLPDLSHHGHARNLTRKLMVYCRPTRHDQELPTGIHSRESS